MVWMTEGKRLVSPECHLGKPSTCDPHADGRRNPKGLLMPFPLMPVDSKTCPSYPQLTFGYDNSFSGETECDMLHLHGGENCVSSAICTHSDFKSCSSSCGRWLLSQCFVLSTEQQPYMSAAAHCQDLESKNFQTYCRQTVQLTFDFHCAAVSAVRYEEKCRSLHCDILG